MKDFDEDFDALDLESHNKTEEQEDIEEDKIAEFMQKTKRWEELTDNFNQTSDCLEEEELESVPFSEINGTVERNVRDLRKLRINRHISREERLWLRNHIFDGNKWVVRNDFISKLIRCKEINPTVDDRLKKRLKWSRTLKFAIHKKFQQQAKTMKNRPNYYIHRYNKNLKSSLHQ